MWQLAAMAVGQRLLLASPVETLARLVVLARTGAFWRAVGFTIMHILAGFTLGALGGAILAGLSALSKVIGALLAPLLTAVRAVPVASFTIVALIWLPSKRLSVLISMLIVLPVVYAGALSGLDHIDPKMTEMAKVFRIPPLRRFLKIDLPAALPALGDAAVTAMGLAWKAGVAAEVIGVPGGSVGEGLYRAKLYLAD